MKLKRKQPKEIKVEVIKEEDYDFDFTIYEKEEKTLIIPKSLKDLKKPTVTNLRNRYAPWDLANELLGSCCFEVSKYAVKVASRRSDKTELWTFYGLLNELWELIRHIYGSHINDDMENLKKECEKNLNACAQKNKINDEIYTKLLELRSRIYQLKQVANFSFEVEKAKGGIFTKTKQKIIE